MMGMPVKSRCPKCGHAERMRVEKDWTVYFMPLKVYGVSTKEEAYKKALEQFEFEYECGGKKPETFVKRCNIVEGNRKKILPKENEAHHE